MSTLLDRIEASKTLEELHELEDEFNSRIKEFTEDEQCEHLSSIVLTELLIEEKLFSSE